MTKDLARGFDIFTRRKPFHLARMQVSTILRFVSERKLIRWPSNTDSIIRASEAGSPSRHLILQYPGLGLGLGHRQIMQVCII
jgi:hypothetical protein